jgi:hypothetical protein
MRRRRLIGLGIMATAALAIALVGFGLYPPLGPWLEWIGLGYALLGLLMLFTAQNRLMMVCFGCSVAVAFYLTEIDRQYAVFRPSISYFLADQDADNLARQILRTNSEAVSVLDIDPTLDSLLRQRTRLMYPYAATRQTGLRHWLYLSRRPFAQCDTLVRPPQ